jgi:hypothetical protein
MEMKKHILIFTSLLLSSLVFSQSLTPEQEAIKNVIQTAYIDGLQNEGDKDKIEAGFHPDFYLLGVGENNEMWKRSIAEWKASAMKKKEDGTFPLTGEKKVTAEYKTIDITGNAAMVKLYYYIGGKHIYTDYLSLYKFGSDWKIVNKIFHKL